MARQSARHYTLWKIVAMAIMLSVLYGYNRTEITATWHNSSLNLTDKLLYTMGHLVGGTFQQETEEVPSQREDVIFDTGSQPQQLSPEVYQLPNYDKSQQYVMAFNASFDNALFNQSFIQLLNEKRQYPVTYGDQLQQGATMRVTELSDYHYFRTTTLSGESFAEHYDVTPYATYQLSEHLYETYIATHDVQANTWLSHSDIFAKYVMANIDAERWDDVPNMQVALDVRANVSSQHLEKNPYVRLVVVIAIYEERGE